METLLPKKNLQIMEEVETGQEETVVVGQSLDEVDHLLTHTNIKSAPIVVIIRNLKGTIN